MKERFAAMDRLDRIISRSHVLHRIVEDDFSQDPKYLQLLILQLDTSLQEIESVCKDLGVYTNRIEDRYLRELSSEGGNNDDE